MRKQFIPFFLSILFLLFFLNLLWGSVTIPIEQVFKIFLGDDSVKSTWRYIVLDSRLPQAITAFFAGSSLAVAGLLLQSVFNNPLAGPSILGIDSGASLGVALVMLSFGTSFGALPEWLHLSGYLTIVLAAFIGSCAVLCLIIFFSSRVKSNVMLLIIGLMVGYFTSAIISILNFFANEQGVQAFTLWGMGDFSSVSRSQLPILCILLTLGLIMALLLIKPLNAILLGERYAQNLGINLKRIRLYLLISTGILTSVTTAFCGPISFIGLAVPHMARLFIQSSNHNKLLPATLLLGGITALFCNLLSNWPGYSGIIPLNAITALIGAPIIIYVIVNKKSIQYFN